VAIVWKFAKRHPRSAAAVFLTIAGGGASYGTKTDPRQILVWANEPMMRPMQEDIRMIKGVVIRMPGADSVIALLEAEKDSIERARKDSAARARWLQ